MCNFVQGFKLQICDDHQMENIAIWFFVLEEDKKVGKWAILVV